MVGITCDRFDQNMADYPSPPRKRYRREEQREESSKSEDDENYVPYVPLKERRKTAVCSK